MIFCLAVLLSMTALADGKSEKSKKSKKSGKSDITKVEKQIKSLKKRVKALEAAQPVLSASVSVNCNTGELINDALENPAVELDITFSGTCFEDVLVTRPKVTLTGTQGAIINGSVSADMSGGTLQLNNVTIQGSTASGLSVFSDSRILAAALNVSGAAASGLLVSNGYLSCADCTSNSNGTDGLTVLLGGRALLAGVIELNDNAGSGLQVLDSGNARTTPDPLGAGSAFSTNSIDISGNGFFGVLLYGASALFIDDNTDMTVDHNGNGIGITTGSTGHFMGSITADGNNVAFGVWGGAIFMRGTLDSSGNNIGLFMADGGTLRGEGTATLTANNIGFFNRGAYTNLAVINSSGNNNLAGFAQVGAIMNNGSANVSGDVVCDGTEVIAPGAGFVCGTN